MAKFFWVLVAIALIGVGIDLFGFSAPPADVAQASITGNVIAVPLLNAETVAFDKAESSFTYIGYGPGKEHTGSFETWDAELLVKEGAVVGFRGTIDAASVTSDNDKLTGHLKTADFFDVTNYSTISFESTGFNSERSEITGILTFRNISKQITFPVVRTNTTIFADFVLNTKPFNMKYEKITNQVRIMVKLVLP